MWSRVNGKTNIECRPVTYATIEGRTIIPQIFHRACISNNPFMTFDRVLRKHKVDRIVFVSELTFPDSTRDYRVDIQVVHRIVSRFVAENARLSTLPADGTTCESVRQRHSRSMNSCTPCETNQCITCFDEVCHAVLERMFERLAEVYAIVMRSDQILFLPDLTAAAILKASPPREML